MARMMIMTLMAVMIIFAFQIIGISIGFEHIGNIFNLATGEITASEFFLAIFSSTSGILLTLIVGGAIIAGFFARAQLENLIVLPFITGTLIALAGVFYQLVNYTGSFGVEWVWMGDVVLVFMGLFTVAYVFTAVEFFRGNV